MKKFFSLFFLLLWSGALLLSLGGCGEKPLLDPEEPVKLTLWHVYGEQSDSPMNRLVEAFNATEGREKGVSVTVTNMTGTNRISTQLRESLQGAPGALELPDLFSSHTGTAMLFREGELVDWEQYFSPEELEGFVSRFLETDRNEAGKLTILPLSKSSYALFFNGSQFTRFSADTGLGYGDLSTWEGFFDAAAQYYRWSGGKPFCAVDYLIRHMELEVLAQEGELHYTEEGWYSPDDQAFQRAFMKFVLPVAQGHIAVSDLYSNTQVMTGETLSGLGSTAAIGYYNDTVTYPDNSAEPMNLRVLPLPKSGEGQQFYPVTGVGISARSTTEQKAAAASVFVHWLTQAQRNLEFAVETGYMPVMEGAFESIGAYLYPDEGYRSLYESINIMRRDYTPQVRPDYDDYYERVNQLYAYLRDMEPAETQAEALEASQAAWDFFCSIP